MRRGGDEAAGKRELEVSVQGVDLDAGEVEALRAELGAIVEPELAPARGDRLLEPRAPPPEGQLDVRFGFGLEPGVEERLRARVAAAVRGRLEGRLPGRHVTVTLCTNAPPGDAQNIEATIVTLPWPPPTKDAPPYAGTTNLQYLSVLYYFVKRGTTDREDAALVIVEDGAQYWGAPNPDQYEVGLATKAPSGYGVDWDKAIAAFSPCSGMVQEIRSGHFNPNPVFMLIRRGAQLTLVFRKPKFLGWWVDMYHSSEKAAWSVFGGKRLTYIWVADNGVK